MKLISLGLDGASFNLLQGWIDKGFLPNLARIQKEGVFAKLQSCLPPVTSPNWKCYSTGKNPGKLGVFWWENIDVEQRKIIIPRSYTFKGEEIWDILGGLGYRVGILNMPTCYPPKEVQGFMVAGGPDALESGFAWPQDLERYLKEKYNWRCLPRRLDFLKEGDPRALEETYNLMERRFSAGIDLARKYNLDFLHITIFLINVMRHFFWKDEKMLKAWQIIDQGIGRLQREFPEADILIFSDHGSGPINLKFNINRWLEKEGYLVLHKEKSWKRFLLKLGLNKDKLTKIAAVLGIKEVLKKHFPKLKFLLPTTNGAIQTQAKEKAINWTETLAVASGQGPVYINKLQITNYKLQNIKEELINKLGKLEHNGIKVAKAIYRKEEIYKGEFLNKAPDIVIDQGEGVHMSGSLGFRKVFATPQKWLADNQRTGMFMAWGPHIAQKKLERISILDLAPTILCLFGAAERKDMDGRILKEILVQNEAGN